MKDVNETIKVISLVDQYPDGGNLWLDPKDPKCGQFILDHIETNMEVGDNLEIIFEEVLLSDFERED